MRCRFALELPMRALVLSDVHSNIDALEAVRAAAPPHDAAWNLGDLVGYGAAPNPVLRRCREMGTMFVRGNHDRACCGLIGPENFNPIALAAVKWTAGQLTPEDTQWLRGLPKGPVPVPNTRSAQNGVAGPATQGVHGAPLDEDRYVLDVDEARAQLGPSSAWLTFFGHTHVQCGYAVSPEGECREIRPVYASDNGAESYELELRTSWRYLINPGSVGQPRDRDWRAAFAIYDEERGSVTFARTPYNVGMAQMRIQRAGLPDMLASRLRVGR